MPVTSFCVGQKFPLPLPPQEGAIMELTEEGNLIVLVNINNLTQSELRSLKNKFNRYGIYEYGSICCWTFNFPSPIKTLDCPFAIGLYKDNRVENYIKTETNTIQFFVIDNGILKAMWVSGLQPEAITYFKEIIIRQSKSFSQESYISDINNLFSNQPEEIMNMGKSWKHN